MSDRFIVLVSDTLSTPPDVEENILSSIADVHVSTGKSMSEIKPLLNGVHLVLAWQELSWNQEVLENLSSCRGIVRVGVGFDNIDLDSAKKKGLIICNVPDYGTEDVADHTMALLLSQARGLRGYENEARRGKWQWKLAPSFRVTEKSLGIIGLGRIGTAVAKRAQAFGLKVYYYDPYISKVSDPTLTLVRCESLLDLAQQSDLVSLHVPLTSQTREMINEDFFQNTREGFGLINTARGAVVEWATMKKYFKNRKLGFFAADVLPIEPPDEKDDLIQDWKEGAEAVRDRILITPHCAFYSEEAFIELRTKAAQEALRILRGEEPLNRIV